MTELLREQSRRTVSRRELRQRHPNLERVSPEVGELDAAELAEEIAEDPDSGAQLLTDLARTTDPALRAKAKALAARLLIPPPRNGEPGGHGGSRLATVDEVGLDIDLDATLERIADHPRLRPEDLRWRGWRSRTRAYVLLLDASGSVAGKPLATAVMTAAALASRLRPGDELAVVAFWSTAVVLRHMGTTAAPSMVLPPLFDLRGGDTTDLAFGLKTALAQATCSGAARQDILVLTDGMANEGDDPVAVAAASGPQIHTLALSEDDEATQACATLAGAGGGRTAPLYRPAMAAGAVAHVLS